MYDAYGSFCLQYAPTGRPLAGYIVFNALKINLNSESLEKNINIATHEILHVLAFNLKLFPYFPEHNGQSFLYTNNQGNSFLRGESILNEMRTHFNCPSISEAPLENEGEDGSKGNHFEYSVFGNELMTSSAKLGYKLSKFTLAILKDSGW